MMEEIIKERKDIWIFGYGSLLWKPNFAFKRSKVGYITGYKRRFWQGDDHYRGDKEKPGRVVTLIEDKEAHTWGAAYEVAGSQIEKCLKYLNEREVDGGGYMMDTVEFFPNEQDQTSVKALVYIATPDNRMYVGPAPTEEIAAQIAACKGEAGHNVEYLLRLAEFMRVYCPEAEDEHLFSIEKAVLKVAPDCGSTILMEQKPLLLPAA